MSGTQEVNELIASEYPKYWIALWNSRLGQAIMRQDSPTVNSQLIVAVMLPQKESQALCEKIVGILSAPNEKSGESK